MKIIESEGIVLRTIKYAESSLILDIFTREQGLRSMIVSGVRSSGKHKSASIFQIMNILQLSYYDNDNDKLCRIKEFTLGETYSSLSMDVIKTSVGVFLIECTRNSVKEMEKNPDLYHFITKSFKELDQIDSHELTHYYLAYLVRLSQHLGFGPMDNYSENCNTFDLLNGNFVSYSDHPAYTMDKESSFHFHLLLNQKKEGIQIVPSIRDNLTDFMVQYFSLHLEGFRTIKSLAVLRTLMN